MLRCGSSRHLGQCSSCECMCICVYSHMCYTWYAAELCSVCLARAVVSSDWTPVSLFSLQDTRAPEIEAIVPVTHM
jgi:hypothetical protein